MHSTEHTDQFNYELNRFGFLQKRLRREAKTTVLAAQEGDPLL